MSLSDGKVVVYVPTFAYCIGNSSACSYFAGGVYYDCVNKKVAVGALIVYDAFGNISAYSPEPPMLQFVNFLPGSQSDFVYNNVCLGK